jgi:acyl transferase domain-containing protein
MESNDKRRPGVVYRHGGTNACIGWKKRSAGTEATDSGLPHLLILSAKGAAALGAATNRLLEFLQSNPDIKWRTSPTPQTGRKAFCTEEFGLCRKKRLSRFSMKNSKRVVSSQVDESMVPGALIPGVGDHPGMAQGLYERCEVFRRK